MIMRSVPIIILAFMIQLPVLAQTDRLDSLLNDVFGNDREMIRILNNDKPVHMLYTGTDFQNKTLYAGREIGDNMINLNVNISYFNSKGISLGASGSLYSQLNPMYNVTTLHAGLYKPLNQQKTLFVNTTYNRYVFTQPDTALDYPFKNNLNTGLSFRNKWFGARISGSFLFGEDFGMNLNSGVRGIIRIIRFGLYNDITFSPEISCYFASETIELESSGSLSGISDDQTSDKYGLLNTQLNLPVHMSLGNFDLGLSYTVNFPTTKDNTIDYPITSFFSFSFGYFIPLN